MKIFGNIFKWLGIGVYIVCAVTIVIFLTPIGGWKALNVLTGSMRPTIQPGTLVLIHKVPTSSIQVGNIITYVNPHNPRQTITHRVIKVSKASDGVTMFTVKGDANPAPDTPFESGYVVGRVALIVPGAGKDINYLHNPWGLAALVIIPGLLVIWAEIRNLRQALAKPKSSAPESKNNEPPTPPAPPASTRPKQLRVEKPTPSRSSRRGLDGMKRAAIVVLALSLVAAGTAKAAGIAGIVHLTGNTFTAVNPTPSPCPPGFVVISNTTHGSVNIVHCRSVINGHTVNINITVVNNQNHQNSNTGNGGSSGNSSNSNNTSTTVSNTNSSPSPSPSASPHPSS